MGTGIEYRETGLMVASAYTLELFSDLGVLREGLTPFDPLSTLALCLTFEHLGYHNRIRLSSRFIRQDSQTDPRTYTPNPNSSLLMKFWVLAFGWTAGMTFDSGQSRSWPGN